MALYNTNKTPLLKNIFQSAKFRSAHSDRCNASTSAEMAWDRSVLGPKCLVTTLTLTARVEAFTRSSAKTEKSPEQVT